MDLPVPTTDLASAADDLERTGIAIVQDAIDGSLVSAARSRLSRVASDERERGTAILESGAAADGKYAPGPNQRILSLLEKGSIFAKLACHDVPTSLTRQAFRTSYDYPDEVVQQFGLDELRLSSVTANIANRGGAPMTLHADQGFVPPTDYPIIVNALWPLVDIDHTNGATEAVPGSHRAGSPALTSSPPRPLSISATAGSVVLIDGRTSHRTGANRTNRSRPVILVTYCRPWVRPFDDRIATVARPLLPSRPWFVYDQPRPPAGEPADA